MPKQVTKFPRSEFHIIPTHEPDRVQLRHHCGSVRTVWRTNVKNFNTCAVCSTRVTAGADAFLIVSGKLATIASRVPPQLAPTSAVYMLAMTGVYQLCTPEQVEAGKNLPPTPAKPKALVQAEPRPIKPSPVHVDPPAAFHQDPWALPQVPKSAPPPNVGYRQFLAVPAKFAVYLTGERETPKDIEDAAAAFAQAHIGDDYWGTFVQGDEWEHEDERYCYVYVPLTESATLVPTGLGGTPLRSNTDETQSDRDPPQT